MLLDVKFEDGYALADMSQKEDEYKSQRFRLDTAGYFAVWLLIVLGAIVIVRSFNNQPTSPESSEVATAVTRQALAAITTSTPTIRPLPSATQTSTNTFTPTPTSAPTETASSSSTPTNTPTLIPSLTPSLPPPPLTATPDALPTPHEIYSWTLRVPILMYHYISVPPADADIYRTDLSVTPNNFRAQMAYLSENRYTTIDLYTLSLAIADKIDLPDKPVIITLDDGYRDNYENAFPILREYNLQATFFVVTEFVDRGYEQYMTWPMIEEMAAAGMRIESHTKSHPDLRGQDRDHLIWQMLGSQETIAAHIGYTPRYFAYPAGHYDEDSITILKELDFWGAVTTRGGKWHGFEDRYEWPRLRVRYDTPLPEFIDLVNPDNTIGGKSTTR